MPKLTRKCQVTIPKHIRKITGISAGDEVEFLVENNKVVVHKKKNNTAFEKYKGLLGQGKTEEVMAEIR